MSGARTLMLALISSLWGPSTLCTHTRAHTQARTHTVFFFLLCTYFCSLSNTFSVFSLFLADMMFTVWAPVTHDRNHSINIMAKWHAHDCYCHGHHTGQDVVPCMRIYRMCLCDFYLFIFLPLLKQSVQSCPMHIYFCGTNWFPFNHIFISPLFLDSCFTSTG